MSSLLVGAIMLVAGGVALANEGEKQDEISTDGMHSLHLFLVVIGVVWLTMGMFWFNVAPQKGNLGVVTRNGQITRLINSSKQTFMAAPTFWKGDQINWYGFASQTWKRKASY